MSRTSSKGVGDRAKTGPARQPSDASRQPSFGPVGSPARQPSDPPHKSSLRPQTVPTPPEEPPTGPWGRRWIPPSMHERRVAQPLRWFSVETAGNHSLDFQVQGKKRHLSTDRSLRPAWTGRSGPFLSARAPPSARALTTAPLSSRPATHRQNPGSSGGGSLTSFPTPRGTAHTAGASTASTVESQAVDLHHALSCDHLHVLRPSEVYQRPF
ncbi:hypothetical protein T484DRAFT_1818011 [Baffinella frigidus]|nr:hypothetical protein T484DRAFT_1818011 [Cryptophyta sp. CCMP2293]